MATDDDDLDLLSLLKPLRRPAPSTAPSPAPQRPPPAPPVATAPAPEAPAVVASPVVQTAPEPDDDDLGGVSIRRPSKPAAAKQAPPVNDAPIASVRVGTERLLDAGAPDAHLRNAASVTEAQRWAALREHLSAAGPDLRWRALGWVPQQEVAFAEKVVQDCRRPRRGGPTRPRKADAVEAAAEHLERTAEHVEAILSSLGPDLSILSGLVTALARAGDTLNLSRQHLAVVCGEGVWSAGWAGCDQGTGLPGYDSPQAIEAHRASVRAEVERFRARRDAQKGQKRERASYVEPPPRAAGILAGTQEVGLFDLPAESEVDPEVDHVAGEG